MTEAISTGPSASTLEGETVVADSNFEAPSSGGAMSVNVSRAEPAEKPEEGAEEALLAGKYKDAAELEKAYLSLQKKLGANSEEEAPADEESSGGVAKMGESPEEENAEASEGDPESSEGDPEDGPKPLDFNALSEEFFANEGLSDESYAALEQAGIPRDFVDRFAAGQKAILQINAGNLYSAAGGEDAFNALVKWGSQNLDEAARDAFDNAVTTAIATGDATAASMLIQGVKAQMGGGEPNLLTAANSADAGNGIQPFASRSEMTEAMRDPRYSRDPSYVKQVQERLRVSEF